VLFRSDKPVITGCLFNANNMPPLALPKNKSISGIKCNSLKNGQGANQFLMDDKLGETRMEIANAYGHKIIQDEKEQALIIHTRDKHTLCMDDKNHSITLETCNHHKIKLQDADSNNEGAITINSSSGHTMVLDDKPKKVKITTLAGHTISLDDEHGRVDISTVDGHAIFLDDKSENMMLISKKGHRLVIDDERNSILLADNNKDHQFKIDMANETITLSTSCGSINLNAPEGEISLSAKNVSLESSNDISIQAGNNIRTAAAMELSASANVVSTKSTAAHTIKGLPVQIN